MLIGELLCRGRLASEVVPPTSLVLSGQREEYVEGLTAWRWEPDGVDTWVSFLSDAVHTAARATMELADEVAKLIAEWHRRSAGRRVDSGARRLIDKLPANPVLDAKRAAALLGRSEEAGRLAILALADDGVLAQVTLGKRNKAWECVGLFALADGLEQRLSRGAIVAASTN